MPKTACLIFPGMNCEAETGRVLEKFDLNPQFFRWNEDRNKLSSFDAFVLPGGFSFEDRGRAGVVAALDPVLDSLKQESMKGKPILGICNGAQILVESDIFEQDLALAPNLQVENGKIRSYHYFNEWVFIKSNPDRETPFNFKLKKNVLKVPIAHGEGRFWSDDPSIVTDKLLFQYSDFNGGIDSNFPTNPNGSLDNAAAICNEAGNVCAMMPHPERSPDGFLIFQSLKNWLDDNKSFSMQAENQNGQETPATKSQANPQLPTPNSQPHPPLPSPSKHKNFSLEIFLSLKITDNEEVTIENLLQRQGLNVKLKRFIWWGVNAKSSENLLSLAREIILKGGIINTHRENITVKIGSDLFKFDSSLAAGGENQANNSSSKATIQSKTPNSQLPTESSSPTLPQFRTLNSQELSLDRGFFVLERENIMGKTSQEKMSRRGLEVDEVKQGLFWRVDAGDLEKLSREKVFSNPSSFLVEVGIISLTPQEISTRSSVFDF